MKHKEEVTKDIIFRQEKYNATIDGQNFFDQPVGNDLVTYDNIPKIATGQGNDHTTGCLLGCNYSKNKVKQKHLMLIQKQYNKLILVEI